MSDVTKNEAVDAILVEEMQELKRDMQSAKVVAWMEEHKNLLMGTVAAGVVLLFAGSFYLESQRTYRSSAATLYQQALMATDAKSKGTLMGAVVENFSDTAYADLAKIQLAVGESRESMLQAVLSNNALEKEMLWQVRLDLADYYIQQGAVEKANGLLQVAVGTQYEELKQYLLYQTATTDDARRKHLEKGLAAASNDAELQQQMKRALAALQMAKSSL
ncbi:MAG: tetratricopeptide repeat protein [Zetaproteobacteria bacterium]|nr:tetratricopeptide repeat protein [Zetaproteobacteria bacterium]